MFDQIVKLIKLEFTEDSIGNQTAKETERTVFAKIESVGQNEFYKGASAGLKPEIKIVLADYLDYEGEQRIKTEGEEVFSVVRTYRKGSELEIVCERKIGNE